MGSAFILLIILLKGDPAITPIITTQEFTTENNCIAVREIVRRTIRGSRGDQSVIECVRK